MTIQLAGTLFSVQLQTLFAVLSATAPLIISLVVVVALAAIAARDMFGGRALDDDKNPYFHTYGIRPYHVNVLTDVGCAVCCSEVAHSNVPFVCWGRVA